MTVLSNQPLNKNNKNIFFYVQFPTSWNSFKCLFFFFLTRNIITGITRNIIMGITFWTYTLKKILKISGRIQTHRREIVKQKWYIVKLIFQKNWLQILVIVYALYTCTLLVSCCSVAGLKKIQMDNLHSNSLRLGATDLQLAT